MRSPAAERRRIACRSRCGEAELDSGGCRETALTRQQVILGLRFAINLTNGDAPLIGAIGGQSGTLRIADITVAPVPAPATVALFGATRLAFGTMRRRSGRRRGAGFA